MSDLESFILVSVLSSGVISMGVEVIQKLRGYSGKWEKRFSSPLLYWFGTVLLGGFFLLLTLMAAKNNSLLVNHFISNTLSFGIGFVLFRLTMWRKQNYCKLV